jgi:hypothetical protein
MAFPELFEWYDIAVKDKESEQKESEQKKATDEKKKPLELANSRSRGHRR